MGYAIKILFETTNCKIYEGIQEVSTRSFTEDAEVHLMRPGSPAIICEINSVSVVSAVMRQESLLDDEDE